MRTRRLLAITGVTGSRGRDSKGNWAGRRKLLDHYSFAYKTLILTGLRRGELASLTLGQLYLEGPHPHLRLNPEDEKNRNGMAIPLRNDLCEDLRRWINEAKGESPAGLGPDASLFTVPRALHKILDRDLEAAGIPKRNNRGRTVDVHALRHTFGTWLSKGGVPLRTAQAALRHSDPKLTANVYTDPALLDVAGALEMLPPLALETGGRDSSLAPMLAPNCRKQGPSG